jgi:hypothetical protein
MKFYIALNYYCGHSRETCPRLDRGTGILQGKMTELPFLRPLHRDTPFRANLSELLSWRTSRLAGSIPGALFWMLLFGLLAVATKYAEASLALKYRRKGIILGGPMIVIENRRTLRVGRTPGE